MSETAKIDYGPLKELIGIWNGDKGMDIAPEPDGTEENPYYETIIFEEGGDVTNAESQELAIVYYRRTVTRKSNNEVFHDETGYWLWDPREQVVMHALTIPRAVSLIAGAQNTGQSDKEGKQIFEVAAGIDNKDWGIVQSPFMYQNAKTTHYHQLLEIKDGRMRYKETTMLDIYGRVFEHVDENELVKG